MTVTADSKKRITLPNATPGDIFFFQEQNGGRILLTRVERPKPRKLTKQQVRRGMRHWKTKFTMTWEELRSMTRE